MRVNLQGRKTTVRLRRHTEGVLIPGNPFITRDRFQFYKVSVSAKSRTREMDACHEIAHVLLCRKVYGKDSGFIANLREEITAWRLARTFCRPEFWDEPTAIKCIGSHIVSMPEGGEYWRKVNWRRLKVIPLNQGITLSP